MKKGSKIALWIIGIILGVFIIGIGGVYIYGNYMFNKVEKVEVDKNDVGITEEVEEKLSPYSNSIINIFDIRKICFTNNILKFFQRLLHLFEILILFIIHNSLQILFIRL